MSTPSELATVAEPSPGRVFWPMLPGVLLGGLLLGAVATRWQPEQAPLAELRAILDEPNSTVRGKGLAAFQTKLRTDLELAQNPEIALELLDRTDRLLARSTPREEAFLRNRSALLEAQVRSERSLLLGDRDYLNELLATLPCSLLPVGLPLLRELASETPPIDPVALAYRRRGALRAIALLGESVQRWQQIPSEHVGTVREYLAQMPASGSAAEGIQATIEYLQTLQTGKPDLLGLDKTLTTCADDRDPTLREGAAFCSRYWSGTPGQNATIDRLLLRLMNDDGGGEELRTQLQIQPAQPPLEPAPVPVQTRPGFLVRSHAVLALAWRGSTQLPLDRLRALLDQDHLDTLLLLEARDGKRVPNEPQVLDLLFAALDATVHLHRKDPARDLSSLMPAIEKLASHPNQTLQKPAAIARVALMEKAKP